MNTAKKLLKKLKAFIKSEQAIAEAYRNKLFGKKKEKKISSPISLKKYKEKRNRK